MEKDWRGMEKNKTLTQRDSFARFSSAVMVSATYFRLAGMNKGVYFSCSHHPAALILSEIHRYERGTKRTPSEIYGLERARDVCARMGLMLQFASASAAKRELYWESRGSNDLLSLGL